MKTIFTILILVSILTGCANKPLVHDYKGDVHVRVLQVELAPIRDPEQNLSGELAKVTKVVKGVQEVLDILTPRQNKLLMDQLHTFEQTLLKGIAKKSGVPVQVTPSVDVNMSYGDHNELTTIDYEYELKQGAYLNVFATIYYTERDDLAVGFEELNVNYIKLVPEIILQIDGYNEKDELFWRQTSRYESTVPYKFGDRYILGVPTKRMQESQIFLIPMAKGAIDDLEILKP